MSMLNDEKEYDKIQNWKCLEKYAFLLDAIQIVLAALDNHIFQVLKVTKSLISYEWLVRQDYKWVKDNFDEDAGLEKLNKLQKLISSYILCFPRMIGHFWSRNFY